MVHWKKNLKILLSGPGINIFKHVHIDDKKKNFKNIVKNPNYIVGESKKNFYEIHNCRFSNSFQSLAYC